MNDPISIEPDGPKRPAFALWGLSQDPPLQTSSATSWDVPLDLYPSVPPELLEGAYVDGYAYGGPDVPQPEPQAAQTPATGREEADPLAALRDLAGEQPATAVKSTLPTRRPRKRSESSAKLAGK